MKKFITDLTAAWDNELQIIQANEEQIIKICEAAINVTKKALSELRAELLRTDFQSKDEEIWFFKEAKPSILSKLIYYDKLYHLEIRRPLGREKLVRKYLENEMLHLEHSYDSYSEFYFYYRTGQSSLDELYFTRGLKSESSNCEATAFDADPNLSTGYDCKVARIIAQDMLLQYLNSEIRRLKGISFTSSTHVPQNSNLQWTGPKIGLVELIYALAQAGVFNNGKADYKEIAQHFETMFNIPLDNIYKIFEKIRSRECGPTTFLDSVKVKLIDYTEKFHQLRIN